MPELPTGTVTFLFTDIEGSTRLWEQYPEAMRLALTRHDALLRGAIEAHDGVVFKTMGDQFCAAFATAGDAAAAALAGQRALQAEPWEDVGRAASLPHLRARMALHTGAAEERGGDYFGPPVNRVARLLAAAHGGQILLSQAAWDAAREAPPDSTDARDLGPHRLKDLQQPEQVFQLLHPTLPDDFPPLRSLEAFVHNLPRQLTSFVGRDQEMAEIRELLSTTSLLTLTGAGGTGKTRLALQVAADLLVGAGTGAYPFPDGVWLVELAPLTDPALVPQTVASVLGIRENPGTPLTETLVAALRSKQALLLLDNCEHLLDACAALAEALLQGCPRVQILATSREGLNIPGESPYRLRSLSVPDPKQWSMVDGQWLMPDDRSRPHQPSTIDHQPSTLLRYEAVQLFLDRARIVAPSLTLTQANAPAVAQICHQLDGIPLAIELAAARVRALPVEKIAERLDDRFRLLTGGSRTALPRQQTLRALIDWSYDLLTEPERTLLRRLSVFAGGWTLEAAEAVCSDAAFSGEEEHCKLQIANRKSQIDDPNTATLHPTPYTLHPDEVLDLLTALVEKSLVSYEEGEGEARYRLLGTVRQYARERLVETEGEAGARGRHRDWFLALAEQAAPELRRPRQAEWLDRLDSEHDNLRAALEWCRAEPVTRVAGADGGAQAEAELRLAEALAWFWTKRSYLSEGRQCLEGALSRSSSAPCSLRARALLAAGQLALLAGDYAAFTFHEAALDIARTTGDVEVLALALFRLGLRATMTGDPERGMALAEESLVWAREAGDPWLIAFCLQLLGVAARNVGEIERAAALFRDSLALARQVGDTWSIVFVLLNVGGVAQAQGDDAAARRAYQEALACSQALKDRRGMAWCLECLAEVAAAEDQPQRAARIIGAAEGILDALGASWPPNYVAGRDRALAASRAALGEDGCAAAALEGRAMALEEAVAYALEEPDA